MKHSKYIPVFIILLFLFSTINTKAIEVYKDKNTINNEIRKINKSFKHGFLKKLYKKVVDKVRKTKREIIRKFKRNTAKRKAKKNRLRGKLKNRNRNLYNILVYSGIFLLFAGLISALLYYTIITLNLFLILLIIGVVTTIIIALIYFSRRYTIKPNFK